MKIIVAILVVLILALMVSLSAAWDRAARYKGIVKRLCFRGKREGFIGWKIGQPQKKEKKPCSN